MVYSTTRIPLAVAGDNPQSEMKKQAIYAVVGVGCLHCHRVLRLQALPVLGARALRREPAAPSGHPRRGPGRTLGATSWIQVGSIQVEPSEIVKVEPHPVARRPPGQPQGRPCPGRVLLLVLALSVLPFLLIYKQDALGSAMVLAVVMVGMLLMAGTRGRHMVALALVAAIAIGGVLQLGVLKQYQKDRLTHVLDRAERGG